ncbi:hypothetical protein JQ596_37920 [Bradyrhizobium manausense]|uniref:hypothetical protein n=1 Tax=Bradyrhizobium TaxID=374 RepID=UPI001BA5EB63|nr:MULTISPECIES: hypothetical protein [Bradyrhizobium]MBR0831299.1 hypothetical protein [Bradyrhizobium manausense]UVO26946.1 hypothetical protein KUF59_30975 [Bradyrhizobium arachidis]
MLDRDTGMDLQFLPTIEDAVALGMSQNSVRKALREFTRRCRKHGDVLQPSLF